MSRFVALDAFRGFTIAAMILVNTPGSRTYLYEPLKHASWHGWTPTDFVFPFFLFIVGSAMYFSLGAHKERANKQVVLQILKRGLIIFAIGLSINALSLLKEPWPDMRIMGVLQRIGIVYIFASLLVFCVERKFIWLVAVAILLTYWALLVFAGDLTAAGNVVRFIDLWILGAGHMYETNGIAFDPEGLLSSIPAIVNTLVGFEVTRFLVTQKDKFIALKKVMFIGIGLLAVGLIWGMWLPINKPMWTSSYVVFTSGVAVVCLAFFVWLVDVLKVKWIEIPLVIYGQNSLFIYVLSMIWPLVIIYVVSVDVGGSSMSGREWMFTQLTTLFSPVNASLVFAALNVLLFWLVAYGLYRKKIIIKI